MTECEIFFSHAISQSSSGFWPSQYRSQSRNGKPFLNKIENARIFLIGRAKTVKHKPNVSSYWEEQH